MELRPAQKVRLGIFVLSSGTILLGAMMVLAGIRLWDKRDLYTVKYAASVSGLEAGSQVRYQGLRVGRVESMRIDLEDPRMIEVSLSLSAGTKLYRGTKAVMALSGITGLKTINLVPGEVRDGVISPGSELPAGASLMEKLEDDAEVIAAKVARVADQLAAWTAPENQERVERILDQTVVLMETIEGGIRRGEEPLFAAVAQLTKTLAAAERLGGISSLVLEDNREELARTIVMVRSNLESTKRILGAVSASDVRRTIRAARGAMESVDRRFSDAELGRLVIELRRSLQNMTGLIGELDLAVRASREDFVLVLKRVREASENLREFSRMIAQDPSILVRGTELVE